ncbi:MAG: hypothetical protein WAU00_10740 [Caldilinea sp.]
MTMRFQPVAAIVLGAMLLLSGCIQPLAAPAKPPPAPTERPTWPLPSALTLSVPSSAPVGAPVRAPVFLHNAEGRGLPNKLLFVYLDHVLLRRVRTNDAGKAEVYLGRDLSVGEHGLRVVADRTEAYQQASATAQITVRPAILAVYTIPPLPGIEFLLDGVPFSSGPDGVARREIAQTGVYSLTMLPVAPRTEGDAAPMSIEFIRWADQFFTPTRPVEIKGDVELYLGLSRSFPVGQKFIDLDGEAVDASRITQLTIKSSHGTRYSYPDGAARWRSANRIARLKNGLEATDVQFAVESVIVDGANVVNQNQQRFLVDKPATWTIQLLLFDARLHTRDALYGFPIGAGIDLHYPDGSVRYFPFDEENNVEVQDLARGMYKVQVVGANGMAPLTPVAVSRDQDVELKVLSLWDLGTFLLLGAVVAFGLLFWGRPQLIRLSWWRQALTRKQRSAPGAAHRDAALPALTDDSY